MSRCIHNALWKESLPAVSKSTWSFLLFSQLSRTLRQLEEHWTIPSHQSQKEIADGIGECFLCGRTGRKNLQSDSGTAMRLKVNYQWRRGYGFQGTNCIRTEGRSRAQQPLHLIRKADSQQLVKPLPFSPFPSWSEKLYKVHNLAAVQKSSWQQEKITNFLVAEDFIIAPLTKEKRTIYKSTWDQIHTMP